MCNDCFSFVQFPGILPTDTHVVINGGTYTPTDTVNDLVDNNPQFWYDFGANGINTLHSFILVSDIDITMSVQRGGTPVTVTGSPAFVGSRPVVVR